MKIAALLFVVIVVGVFLFAVMIYNKLVRVRNQAKNGFAQIDVQLKRRHDLIPNLVEVSKRYLTHEQETLTQVIAARNQAQALQDKGSHDPESLAHMAKFAKAEGLLSQALGQFYAVAENYPNLKADALLRELTDELTNTENRIGFARQHYNDCVMFYNNEREIFPNTIISGMFAFRPLAMLEFQDKAAISQVPKVSFD